jgi:hypothetical protein
MQPEPPTLTFVFELRVQVGVPLEVGRVRGGQRRVVPITGGTFEGPGIKGAVLAGGADWQMVQDDGVAEIDARYTLQTDRGQLIHIRNVGIRRAAPEVMRKLLAGERVDPSVVYFRSVPTFETSAPELDELTRNLHVASGERYPTEVVIRVWRVQ